MSFLRHATRISPFIGLVACSISCAAGTSAPIDRHALVSRHDIDWPAIDGQIPLGNGNFAFNADGTGLETVGGNTMSHWSWHNFPLPPGVTQDDIKPWATSDHGRLTGKTTPPPAPIAAWEKLNPQPLNLGRLGFIDAKGARLKPSDVKVDSRHLDLWTGLLTSHFTYGGAAVAVETCVDPKSDTVAVHAMSPLFKDGRLQIMLDFPSPNKGARPWDGNFSEVAGHQTDVIHCANDRLEVNRTIDDAKYQVALAGSGFVVAPGSTPHQFIITATPGSDTIDLTCRFGFTAATDPAPSTHDIEEACAVWWPAFWKSGGAIDLSGSKDPRWMELERRIVLSQYELAVQSAGDYPPAEVGLTARVMPAENGPAQNIRFYNVYSGTDKPVACTSTFGQPGGIFSGKTPGLIRDPAAGGDARFFGPTGVGLDAAGNIYVVCNSGGNQTDLRAFSPDGKLLWSVFGLEMTHTGDFDPTLGDSDVWTATHHYTMDYKGSTPGGEWKLKSYLTNPFLYTYPSTFGGTNAVYRKVKGTPLLFTGGQGVVSAISVFRFSGEEIIPCGSFTMKHGQPGMQMWCDANGDGVEQPGEDSVLKDVGGLQSFDVANNGDIYIATGSIGGPRPKVAKIPFQGFNAKGSPVYSTTTVEFASLDQFNDPVTGNVSRLRYVGGPLDTMYLLGRTNLRPADKNYGGFLGCYDHWSTKPVKRFVTVLPTPEDDLNFLNYPPYSGDGFIYEAFDVANGITFCTDLWGTIRVIDAKGNFVMNMLPGPDISADNAWEDENMGLRAHYNAKRGEYDILTENSGFRARENFFRWKPKP